MFDPMRCRGRNVGFFYWLLPGLAPLDKLVTIASTMKKKYLLSVAILLLHLTLVLTAFAETRSDKETRAAAKVKTNITKLGTGSDALVEVKLRDGTKVKGYVSEINDSTFIVVNDDTATSTEVPYSNAKQVKGNNLSTGKKIAIGVAIGVAVFVVAVVVIGTRLGSSVQ